MGALLNQARERYETLRSQAVAITEKAMAENRDLTDAEQKQLRGLVEQAKQAEAGVKTSRGYGMPVEQLDKLINAHLAAEAEQAGGGMKAAGQRDTHPWTKAALEASEQGAFGLKGVTGGGQGTVMVGSLSDPAARLGAPGGELLALLTIEEWGARGDGAVVSFLRQVSRTLRATVVATAAQKPQSDLGLDMLSADCWTFAHYVGAVPLQWIQDASNLDQLISSELAYGVTLAIEAGLVNGAGPLPGAPLGILHDGAVQQVPAGVDAPGSILAGLTAISSAGYSTGVVALNPGDWEAIQGMKDLNERPIYGGSPFAGPQRTLWSTPVVLSNAIPAGKSIVGDIGGAVRLVERQPVGMIVGTETGELTKNLRTFVGEARCAFATTRPEALAVVTLPAGTGTLSARSASSKTAAK